MEDPRRQLSDVSENLSWLAQKGQWEVRPDRVRGQGKDCMSGERQEVERGR